MKTFSDVVASNIEEDVKELNAYKNSYVMHAALSKDAGHDDICSAYLKAILNLEMCIQSLETISAMTRRT